MKRTFETNLVAIDKIIPICLFLIFSFFSDSNKLAAQTVTQEDPKCVSCHQMGSATPAKKNKKLLIVQLSEIRASAHKNLSCKNCHNQISKIPHAQDLPLVDCSSCHPEEGASYASSIHGRALASGDKDVPQCKTCHGTHKILKSTDPQSSTFPSQLLTTCLSCHLDQRIEADHLLPGPEIIKAYEESIHGKAVLKSGLQVSAVCNDCHGSHHILPADDTESMVHKINIPPVCGKCHTKIFEEFRNSIHGQAIEKTVQDAPVCTDCHGEHSITRISDPESGVYSTTISKTCSGCHESETLVNKYGLPAKRLATFMSSYHGVAAQFGQSTVANCSSCHGIHDIRPSDDPLSSIHPSNLSQTCGFCHPGIGEEAPLGKIHIEATPESSKGKFFVRRFYYWFIGSLMVLFLLYVFFDIRKHRKMKKKQPKEG
ncbi:hypothetical protein ACFLRM_05510 [Acidobacteriota bacterium]